MSLPLRALTCLVLGATAPVGTAQEFRALWADTFHAGLRNSAETSALISAARDANCNAVVVEVRKRGDAYYRNGLEPVATDVAAGFDPLADLIEKGHAGPERVEVHAWVVTYNIWNNQTTPPVQPTHPYNLHPDWVSQNNVGAKWDGGNYQLDPGHPAVQEHTYNVIMDIATRYDVDGIHFDYVRYSENGSTIDYQPWGYNPVTVARFKKLTNRSATPAPGDAVWLQWRRDQVTALVRKVYLNAWAAKPNVRISAALIPWGTAPALPDATHAAWKATNAYARVLQDWRGWMEEGILDLACPMDYRRATDNAGFDAWANYAKERQYNRAAAIGMGWYLNPVSNTITQIKLARAPSPSGKNSVGVLGYSYAVTNNEQVSSTTMRAALVDDATAEIYDPGGTPVFASPVAPPAMPWKTNSAKGHMMGAVRTVDGGTAFDGITVTISGPATRTVVTDATGFFGAVDLPAGNYTVSINLPGYSPVSRSIVVAGAAVTQSSVQLAELPFVITAALLSPAGDVLAVTWNSVPGRTYRVEGSNDLKQWSPVAAGVSATSGNTTYPWQVPVAWRGRAFVRVVAEQ